MIASVIVKKLKNYLTNKKCKTSTALSGNATSLKGKDGQRLGVTKGASRITLQIVGFVAYRLHGCSVFLYQQNIVS